MNKRKSAVAVDGKPRMAADEEAGLLSWSEQRGFGKEAALLQNKKTVEAAVSA
jgi:hypothetical protein